MVFFKHLFIKNQLVNNDAFIWNAEKKILKPIKKIKTFNLDLITAIERQKKILLENTKNFSNGSVSNNALLWGVRGNGKSTLVKSIFNNLKKENKYLKLIQLNKDNILDIDRLYEIVSNNIKMRFIIFVDDLSFEKIDSDYKIIKSSLDGSIQAQPTNSILYITSNRRHLMPKDMIDNERSSAIHTDESIEEKISLSDRFGLWIGFHNFSQIDYLKIVKTYCYHYNIDYNTITEDEALKWSIQRGNRSGRTAWQYIINSAVKNNLKLDN